jgi:phosphate:Na+ symporter
MALQWSSLLGGLGLFLWGMHMLSQGLRLAAGSALQEILAKATGTRLRGLAAGAVTTAIVQSSSAVTVATIGFVNANLLTLSSAIWVLFGANLGTTATGWIVAFAGLKLDLSAVSLPLIAIGATLKLAGAKTSVAAWGEAIAGFGMLFYGIGLMQSGFVDLSTQWQIPQAQGLTGIALQALAGIAMTVVMQSSSASTAIALTAAQAGLIDLTGGAAVVIGANIGTTVTAMLASIGATPNAKRVAAAHVLFNVITALAAFIILPWLVPAIASALAWFNADQAPGTVLALFNTLFNALGIALIWPLATGLTRWLGKHFEADLSAGAKPMFLDSTTLLVPNLAIRALSSELDRMLAIARDGVRLASTQAAPAQTMLAAEQSQQDLRRLLQACETFIDQLNRQAMDADTVERLAALLRVRRYLENVVENQTEVLRLPDEIADQPALEAVYSSYCQRLQALLPDTDLTNSQDVDALANAYEAAYQLLKHSLLQTGAVGTWRTERMERALRRISAQRHATQQLLKGQRWLKQATADDATD